MQYHQPTKHRLAFRHKILDLSTPKVMGVLNVTPDSFSDGGRFNSVDTALKHCEQLLSYGVDIIDIGGESTRPNAPKVSTEEELQRVLPVVNAIRQRFGDEPWLSLDTSSPDVMRQGINAGADMINDVRGLKREGACQAVADLGCPVVIMHSRGEPDTMNELAVYDDVVSEIISELQTAVLRATDRGVQREQIIVDVGMGFAKNYQHHIAIMQHLAQIIDHFGLPMLFGVSRKRFLGEILSQSGLDYLSSHQPADRDNIGTVAHLIAIQQGANIVRVHDVKNMVQAVRLFTALHNKNRH